MYTVYILIGLFLGTPGQPETMDLRIVKQFAKPQECDAMAQKMVDYPESKGRYMFTCRPFQVNAI